MTADDTARLDWLEAHTGNIDSEPGCFEVTWKVEGSRACWETATAKTLREAVDKAMHPEDSV